MIRDIATIKLIEKLESENAILREAITRIAKPEYGPRYCLTADEQIARKALQRTGGGE